MRHDDLIRRLTDARPRHLDHARPVPEETRRSEPARIMADSRAGDEAPRAAGGFHRRLRPVWTAGLACGVAAVAAVTLVARPPGPAGPDTAADRPHGPSRVLLVAAERVEKSPRTTGTYWFTEVHQGRIEDVPGGDYRVDVRTVEKRWIRHGTSRQWSRTWDVGTRPATEADEKRWLAAGSPRSWHLGEDWPPGPATWRGRGLTGSDAPGGPGDRSDGPVQLDLADVQSLPTRPDLLRARLRVLVEEKFNAPEKVRDRLIADAVEKVAMTLPVSPEVRAAAYRLLAELPDVRDLGKVTDHAGRPAYGVALPGPRGERERRLFFDRKTGRPLGTAFVALHGRHPDRVTAYSTFTAMHWTDEAPGFDASSDRL